MPIRYYEGVEGSGKTCMMTRDLYLHCLAGGKVLAFPGYELYGNNKKQILSETIEPGQLLSLLDGLKQQKIAIAGDEITNFINHHNWWSKICDIMYAILAQRRKLGIAMLLTGPLFYKLPPDMRDMIHEIVHCQDNHVLNHAIKRGQKCIYYKEDLRGLLSNPKHRFSRKKVFFMPPWYRHYDTYAAVDLLHQFVKYRFKGKEVIIGADGQVLSGVGEFDSKKADAFFENYNSPNEKPLVSNIKAIVNYCENKGMTEIPVVFIKERLNMQTLSSGQGGVGAILKNLGYQHNRNKGIYKKVSKIEVVGIT